MGSLYLPVLYLFLKVLKKKKKKKAALSVNSSDKQGRGWKENISRANFY